MIACWSGAARAATFQFEVIGASSEWVVIRENVRPSTTNTDSCRYEGLDPSEYAGSRVRFINLSDAARRGQLVELGGGEPPMPLYNPARRSDGCTSQADADSNWRRIATRAESIGIEITPQNPPVPVVLGTAVPASACVLVGAKTNAATCRRTYMQRIDAHSFRIAVALTSVPEAPDLRTCQFYGHRFGAAIQVSGLDFGTADSGMAPGGFAAHYDCREQQFEPLRFYSMNGYGVLVGGFRGMNIADRDEHPFIVAFRTRR
jgi:hypothetical protein